MNIEFANSQTRSLTYARSAHELNNFKSSHFGSCSILWNDKYPMIQAAWERNWNELIEFFNYPMDIRKAIYTTNAIESLNFSLRKITRNKSSFPDDDSIYKVMYLAIRNASKRWTMPIRNWAWAVRQASYTIWQTDSNLLIRTYPFTQFSWQARMYEKIPAFIFRRPALFWIAVHSQCIII